MKNVSTPPLSAFSQSSFEELINKLFQCNIILMPTDHARESVQTQFGSTSLATIFNQFSVVDNLHLTIRDLNGHNAYGLRKLRLRFHDVSYFKNRPNSNQLQKAHYNVVSSMSNKFYKSDNENGQSDLMNQTPWYDLWKNFYLDTFESSDHDFIGTSCGCFFVITKAELPHYRVIFERLCATVSPWLTFHSSC